MIRRVVLVLLIAVALMIATSIMTPMTPTASAIDWCARAETAHWMHKGLNGACMIQRFLEWFADGGYLEPDNPLHPDQVR